MKAAVPEKVEKLTVKEIAKPTPKEGEVLLRINVCGLCGTDLKLYRGSYTANLPLVLGHEFSGEVVEIDRKTDRTKGRLEYWGLGHFR